MATFTMVLKDVIEMEEGKIGLDDYPIFDEDYRDSLNQKIIDHYWNQEIGQETISMFRHAMKRRMNEIMPLYNEQYRLNLVVVDPLSTMSIKNIVQAEGESTGTSEAENTANGTSENESVSAATSRAVASDTPQTALQANADYATSMQDSVSESTARGSAQDASTSKANETRGEKNTTTSESGTTGYSGHAPMLILAARQALVNVDLMVINELSDLFMLIWSSNDSYTQNNRLGFFHYGY